MLVLTRKTGESIVVPIPAELPAGCELTIQVCQVRGERVRLGITAPRTVPVHREEVWKKLCEQGRPHIHSEDVVQ